jgi:cell division protein FtsL
MDQKERQVLVTLFATVLIFTIYSLYVYNRYISADPDIINSFRFWGNTFIVLIPVAIVVQIIIHIIFAIINKIVTNEDIESLSDERDKLIELKSIRISHWIFTLGFTLAMGSQALRMEPWVMFVTLIGSGFLSGLISEAAKLYYYRKGV